MPSPRPPPSRVFLFNLPVTWQTPVAERIYGDELRRLGQFLIGLGGHAPAAGDLVEIMTQYSQARRRLLEAAAWCPARAYAEAVARFHLDGSVHLPPERGCPQPQQSQQGARESARGCLRSCCGWDSRAPGAGPSRWPWSEAPCRNHKCRCWMPSRRPAGVSF